MKTTNFSIGWCFIMEGSFEIADRFWMYGWYIFFFDRSQAFGARKRFTRQAAPPLSTFRFGKVCSPPRICAMFEDLHVHKIRDNQLHLVSCAVALLRRCDALPQAAETLPPSVCALFHTSFA
jgi:hypothetical protein